MDYFVIKTEMPFLGRGWGNGYVVIPQGHELYGFSYDRIHETYPEITVHGGITLSEPANDLTWPETNPYSGSWVLGFDTAHYCDTPEKWSKDDVIEETLRFRSQIISIFGEVNEKKTLKFKF